MKRFAAIIAILLLAALTASAAPYFPVTLSFTNSVTFTNNGPRAILAKVTVSVVTPQAASATIAIGGPSGTNTILYSTSTVFRVAHWPPSSTSTNTYLASNDTVIVSCTAAGQSYVVIDAVPFEQDEFVPLLIVDGNNVTSQPTVLKFSGSAQTDLGGGRWMIIQNSSTSLLEKSEAALLYATTQAMAAAEANIDQEVLDREADVLDLQQFTSALLNTQIQHKAIMDGFSTNLTITTDRANSNVTAISILSGRADTNAQNIADLYGKTTTNTTADAIVSARVDSNAVAAAIVSARVDSQTVFNATTYATKTAAITNAGFTINGQPASNGAVVVISTLDTNAAAWLSLTTSVGQAQSTASAASATGTAAYALAQTAANTGTAAYVLAQRATNSISYSFDGPINAWDVPGSFIGKNTFSLRNVYEVKFDWVQLSYTFSAESWERYSISNGVVYRTTSQRSSPGGGFTTVGPTLISSLKDFWYSGNDGSGSGMDADTVDGYTATDFALLTTLTTGGYLRITSGAVTSNSMPGTRGEFRRSTTNAYFHDGSQWVTWSVSTNFSH